MERADANVLHEERDRMQSECLKAVFATYFRILKQRTPHLMGAVLEVRITPTMPSTSTEWN